MRGLAQALGGELLDGMVDLVFGEIESPSGGTDWKAAMRRRGLSVREALKRHSPPAVTLARHLVAGGRVSASSTASSSVGRSRTAGTRTTPSA